MTKEHSPECGSHPDSKHYHQPCSCPPPTTPSGSVEENILKLLEETKEKVTDYGYNDEYGYYNDWADGVRPILSQALTTAYTAGRSSIIKEMEEALKKPKQCEACLDITKIGHTCV